MKPLQLKEARRYPGSEWLKDHPRFLNALYQLTRRLIFWLYPTLQRMMPGATHRLLIWTEKIFKGWIFNCQMCGQCILHSTGMTCPMTCPKNLRNGPCGGVRADGHCEVIPERMCVWVQAWERSQKMGQYREDMQILQPPLDNRRRNTSSWANMVEDAKL